MAKVMVVNSGHLYSTKNIGDSYFHSFKVLGHKTILYPLECLLEKFRKYVRFEAARDEKFHATYSAEQLSTLKANLEVEAREWASSGILSTVFDEEPDAVIFIQGINVPIHIPIALRKIGIPTAVILTDEPQEVDKSTQYSWAFPFVFTNDRNTIERHKDNAVKHINYFSDPVRGAAAYTVDYLPTAVDATLMDNFGKLAPWYQCDVLFAGSIYPERLLWLQQNEAMLQQFNFRVVGPCALPIKSDWLKSIWINQKLEFEEWLKYIRGAKVFLDWPRNANVSYPHGFCNKQKIPATNISPRIYEAAMCESLIMAPTNREDLYNLFDVPQQMVLWANPTELEILLKKWLSPEMDFERLERVKNAKEHVLKHHTYEARAKKILSVMEIQEGTNMIEVKTDFDKLCNANVNNKFGDLWNENFEKNLLTIQQSQSLDDLKDAHKGKIGIVVSNGPSLAWTLPKLQKYYTKIQSDCILITTNGAYKELRKVGITPEYLVIIHPEDNQYERQIKDSNQNGLTTLLVSSVVHPSTYQHWKGTIRFFHAESNLQFNKTFTERVKLTSLMGGVTVATLACSTAIHMGCTHIVFVGQDFAYTNNQKYMGVPLSIRETNTVKFIADDIYGNVIVSDMTFNRSCSIIIKMAEHYKDIVFTNCSEGGILHGNRINIDTLDNLFADTLSIAAK